MCIRSSFKCDKLRNLTKELANMGLYICENDSGCFSRKFYYFKLLFNTRYVIYFNINSWSQVRVYTDFCHFQHHICLIFKSYMVKEGLIWTLNETKHLSRTYLEVMKKRSNLAFGQLSICHYRLYSEID